MRFTDFAVIDPVLSIGVSAFIFVNAVKNIKEIQNLFLEKIPEGIDAGELKEHILEIDGVSDVHHIHIWSMDGHKNNATMHIVAEGDGHEIKDKIRHELKEHNIGHVTLELESPGEHCHHKDCHIEHSDGCGHHHHHHH